MPPIRLLPWNRFDEPVRPLITFSTCKLWTCKTGRSQYYVLNLKALLYYRMFIL
jgi:hypothetical protein